MSGGDAVDLPANTTIPTLVEVTGLAERLGMSEEEAREKIRRNDWGLGEAQTVVEYCREQNHNISFEQLSEAGLVER